MQGSALPQVKGHKNVRARQLVGGHWPPQEGVPASCLHSSVVQTVVLHFMSLVTKEQ